jgi:glycosyltransferase involved in cell wall biosynthesis
MNPTVSVIMAAYNGASLIAETIAALRGQTFADWELIVVDDRSTDDTVRVLRAIDDPRIRLIESEANGGPVVARNRAFAEAGGRYTAALDQDDICLPERFAKEVAYLDAHPEVALVSTAARVLYEGREEPGHWPRGLTPGLIDWLMLIQNPIVWSSVMFRTDAARRLDPFERPEMRYVEDFDFYTRIRTHGLLAQIDEELLLYREHSSGASNVFNTVMRDHAEALLGGHAPDIAPLLVRHVMARDPVPNGETLRRLFAGIARLRDGFCGDAHTLALVDREISRLWWRLCRAGVRSGRIALHQALAARPDTVSLGEGSPADLVVSQMIGGVRALRRGLGRA